MRKSHDTVHKQQSAPSLADFPKSERWRLFIDGYRQNEGPFAFDAKEPGYLQGVEKAFDQMLQTLGEPLIVDMLVDFHNTAIKPVNELSKTKPGTTSGVYKKKEFALRGRNGTEFGLVLNSTPGLENNDLANMSPQGLAELVDYMQTEQGRFVSLLSNGEDIDIRNSSIDEIQHIIEQGNCACFLAKDYPDNMEMRIEGSITQYRNQMSQAQTPDEKLSAIITLAKDLEVNHYFTDANCRTTVCMTMNKLLIENGFTPAIFTNPNRIDGYSIAELVDETKVAMSSFESCCLQKETKSFLAGATTDDMKNPSEFCHQLAKTLPDDTLIRMAHLNHICQNLDQLTGLKSEAAAPGNEKDIFQAAREQLLDRLLDSVQNEMRDVYVNNLEYCVHQDSAMSSRVFQDVITQHTAILNDQREPGRNIISKISSAFDKPGSIEEQFEHQQVEVGKFNPSK